MPSAANHHDRTADDDQSPLDRCMLYLLGELSAAESAEFEQCLAESPELNRELLVQSELLCALAAGENTAIVTVATPPSSVVWRAIIVISALAACLTIALVGFRSLPENEQSVASVDVAANELNEEALLIAQAWAASRVLDKITEADWSAVETEFDLNSLDAPDNDSVLSWMVVAVAADADMNASPAGASSDG